MRTSRLRHYGLPGALVALLLVLGSVLVGSGSAASDATPSNTAPPTISGTAKVGQTLTADHGTWSGTTPITYIYQWQRCDSNGGACAADGGTTTQASYTVTSADTGKTLRVQVTATNSDGSASSTSVPTSVVTAASPPVNTAPPAISGSAVEGQTLTASTGTWSGATPITYVYQWLRCDRNGGSCASSGGSTTQNVYHLSSADIGTTVRVAVTATNSDGSQTSTSVPTALVASAKPANGCSTTGTGPITVAGVASPARLAIDGQQASPTLITRSTTTLQLRFHVTACSGRPVSGALVYATAVPFEQFTVPPEAATGSDGWATLTLHRAAHFPASSQQQLLAVFVRARKPGENPLGGISTRLLVSFPVNLRAA